MIAVAIMFVSSGSVARFVEEHPTVKVLALSFLLLIGCSLIADGFGVHIPKGYIYFAMGFSIFVEVINLTGESRRGHRRSDNNVFFASPGFARYMGGLRFTLGGR